jgi:hypothetical protein
LHGGPVIGRKTWRAIERGVHVPQPGSSETTALYALLDRIDYRPSHNHAQQIIQTYVD